MGPHSQTRGERILCGHVFAGLLWERQFENVLIENGWEKVANGDCFFMHRQKSVFLPVQNGRR